MLVFFESSSSVIFIKDFCIAFAAFLAALGTIYGFLVKPLRSKLEEKLITPLHRAISATTETLAKLTQIETRLADLETKWAQSEIGKLTAEIESLRYDNAFLLFRAKQRDKSSRTPTFLMDAIGSCISANSALCDLLECDSADLVGRDWINLIAPSDRATVRENWRRSYEDGIPYDYEQNLLICGKPIRCRVSAEPFVFEGRVKNFLGTVQIKEAR